MEKIPLPKLEEDTGKKKKKEKKRRWKMGRQQKVKRLLSIFLLCNLLSCFPSLWLSPDVQS